MTDVRERLARIISDVFACAIQNGEVAADAILAAFPELTPPVAPGHTDLMVTPESLDSYLEANPPPPPGSEAVEGAREIANRYFGHITGVTDQPADILADEIAAFATACAARERDDIIALIRHTPSTPNTVADRLVAAIRRRTP